MPGLAAVWRALLRLIAPPPRPVRVLTARRVRLFAAVGAGGAGGALLLLVYYATLGLLPPAFAYPETDYPVADWAHRLDLAQFIGTFLLPPIPTPQTWWLGLAALFGALIAFGIIYAILLAWTLQRSEVVKGAAYGVALFVGLIMILTIANGLHPAVMRSALPDTGLFLLGWSPLAMLQLLLVHLLYGAVLGTLYQHWTVRS